MIILLYYKPHKKIKWQLIDIMIDPNDDFQDFW